MGVKIGRWIYGTERKFYDSRVPIIIEMEKTLGRGYHTYQNMKCSECGKITIVDKSIRYDYCPHCGAEMESDQ